MSLGPNDAALRTFDAMLRAGLTARIAQVVVVITHVTHPAPSPSRASASAMSAARCSMAASLPPSNTDIRPIPSSRQNPSGLLKIVIPGDSFPCGHTCPPWLASCRARRALRSVMAWLLSGRWVAASTADCWNHHLRWRADQNLAGRAVNDAKAGNHEAGQVPSARTTSEGHPCHQCLQPTCAPVDCARRQMSNQSGRSSYIGGCCEVRRRPPTEMKKSGPIWASAVLILDAKDHHTPPAFSASVARAARASAS